MEGDNLVKAWAGMDLGYPAWVSIVLPHPMSHLVKRPSSPQAWLHAPGSLTRRLARACPGVLRVGVVEEGWTRAALEPARRLGVRMGRRIWRREVVLRCDGRDYVHAVTWVTEAGWRALGLGRLGGRPLGHVLFRRSARRLRREILPPREGRPWARRTLYVLRGHRLLVREDFLPGLPPMSR